MKTKDEGVNLLWTGGWDSTFRLLELTILKKKCVQPHYLIDPDRESLSAELRSMRDIKHKLFACYPETRARLLPTKMIYVEDIPANPAIDESYARVEQRQYLGTQYNWIARYCSEAKIENIEMGLTRGEKQSQVIEDMITETGVGAEKTYWVARRYADTDEFRLFGQYRFPVFNFSKQDMEKIARKNNLQELMDLTWFCHHPLANGNPCGVCSPCSYLMRQGMHSRIPFWSRLRYYLSPSAVLQRVAEQNKTFRSLGRVVRHAIRANV
jgi:hypothetical protein